MKSDIRRDQLPSPGFLSYYDHNVHSVPHFKHTHLILINVLFWFRLEKIFSRRTSSRQKKDPKKDDEIISETEDHELYVERIRLENMELRFLSDVVIGPFL